MNIIEALDDQHLIGSAIRTPEAWSAWRSALRALSGPSLSAHQATLDRDCTLDAARVQPGQQANGRNG